ncbi:MAG TPA: hypothetical protein VFG04_02715 [Planctomycetaceae bacterium]|jgi:hypothetical protein|nr:hypothetical protein [Planctomycetaceae bacterium]
MKRILGLLFGIPILLIGLMWISIDVGLMREGNQVPVMGICGALFVWLGYRLIFAKPVNPSLARSQRHKLSN